MVTFLDGPAEGTVLQLKRAPEFLRVVQSAGGTIDALDQLDDVAHESESIHVYRLTEGPTRYHLNCRPRSGSGWYMAAVYRLWSEQPGDDVRENQAWREWATNHSPPERTRP